MMFTNQFNLRYMFSRICSYPLHLVKSPIKKIILKERYRILKSLSSSLAEDPVVKASDFCGVFELSRNSDIFSRILINKSYEPQLVSICKKYANPEKDIIDIGANVGFYSILFATISPNRRVLAVEPTRRALDRLYKNISINKASEVVEIYEGVVSELNGPVEIKTIVGKEEYSSLGEMSHPSIHGENWSTEEVSSVTLDQLVEQKSLDPGFIKVDTEGAEHLVFSKASRTLSVHRPVVLSELSDYLLKKNGSSAQYVIDLFRAQGYRILDPINPYTKPGKKRFGDILCIPEEYSL